MLSGMCVLLQTLFYMRAGGEGTFCDDEDVRKSLAASQEGLAGQPEPHALVSMSSAEGIAQSCYILSGSSKGRDGNNLDTMCLVSISPLLRQQQSYQTLCEDSACAVICSRWRARRRYTCTHTH